jgi:hypothetical protein
MDATAILKIANNNQNLFSHLHDFNAVKIIKGLKEFS